MKYALLALALVAAIPGCSCMRKDKAPKKEKKTHEKSMKKETDKAVKKAKASSGKEHMSSY